MSVNNTEWKVFQYRVSSGLDFSVFSPNAGKYGPEKNSVFGHFSRSANTINNDRWIINNNYRCK